MSEVMTKVVASAGEGVKKGAVETIKPVEALKPLSEGADSVADETNKTADDLTEGAKTNGIGDTLKNFGDGEGKTPTKDQAAFGAYDRTNRNNMAEANDNGVDNNLATDENPVTFGNIDQYKKNLASVQPEDTDASTVEPNKTDTNTPQNTEDKKPVETSDVYQSQKDTNPDKVGDQAEPPAEDKKVEEKKSPEDIAKQIADLRKILRVKNEEYSKKHDGWSDTIEKDKLEDFAEVNIKIEQLKKELPGKDRDNTEPPLEENEMTGAEVLDKMNKDAAAKKLNENWKKIYEGTNMDNPPTNTEDQAPGEESQKPKDKKNEGEQKPPDGEKKDEKTGEKEDLKSEKQKQIEEKMQMADIVSQMKDINPNFNPKDPETRKFLEDLAGNPDQMKAAGDTLKMLGENKTTLENLGFDSKDINSKTVQAMTDQVDKKVQEHAKKSNPTKEEEDENKNNISLLSLLKMLLGGVLVSIGATVMTAGKEISKK